MSIQKLFRVQELWSVSYNPTRFFGNDCRTYGSPFPLSFHHQVEEPLQRECGIAFTSEPTLTLSMCLDYSVKASVVATAAAITNTLPVITDTTSTTKTVRYPSSSHYLRGFYGSSPMLDRHANPGGRYPLVRHR